MTARSTTAQTGCSGARSTCTSFSGPRPFARFMPPPLAVDRSPPTCVSRHGTTAALAESSSNTVSQELGPAQMNRAA
eukprot:9360293-Pyramimonas_sp.AAC.1